MEEDAGGSLSSSSVPLAEAEAVQERAAAAIDETSGVECEENVDAENALPADTVLEEEEEDEQIAAPASRADAAQAVVPEAAGVGIDTPKEEDERIEIAAISDASGTSGCTSPRVPKLMSSGRRAAPTASAAPSPTRATLVVAGASSAIPGKLRLLALTFLKMFA